MCLVFRCVVFNKEQWLPMRFIIIFKVALGYWVFSLLACGVDSSHACPCTTLVSRCPGRRKGVLLAQKLSFPLALGCQGPRGNIQGTVVGLWWL